MLFDARILRERNWNIAAVVGDIDLATLPRLKATIDGVDAGDLAIDLSGVDHLDPIGLGLVIAASRRARRRDARFAVVCPPGRTRNLLSETRLDSIIEVVATRDALD